MKRNKKNKKKSVYGYFDIFVQRTSVIINKIVYRISIIDSRDNSFETFSIQVLNICTRIMDELIPDDRADRDFRVKFPDDVIQENLAGQLWFGAEVRLNNTLKKEENT